jgi:glycosyltransferase involved in cell wall biosynthesis
MIRDQLSCDLIIAPLEVGNPFCEAKSELKFFEAALAGCPVIASATRTFSEASEDGSLAELATTSEQWLQAFRNIYRNYPAALERAQRARQVVREKYSQEFAATAYGGHRRHRARFLWAIWWAPQDLHRLR